MSSSVRDTFISVAICSGGHADLERRRKTPFFRRSVGISEQRLALPQRSPSPFSVPWICARAGTHRGERIGHRLLGVVMGVDADMAAGDLLCHRG